MLEFRPYLSSLLSNTPLGLLKTSTEFSRAGIAPDGVFVPFYHPFQESLRIV